MVPAPKDHQAFLERVVAALNLPDDDASMEALRALATPEGWEKGGLRRLWKLRRDKVVFGSAGVLSPRGARTLGCVRYERSAASGKPARSVFVLLAAGADGYLGAGVYDEIPLALAWLRGWISAGQRAESLPADPAGESFAAAAAAAPHGALAAFLCEHLDADPALATQAGAMLPDGPARVLGVHTLQRVGRSLIGVGVGDVALWLVIERDVRRERPQLVSVLVRPSFSALLTGAREAAPAQDGADLFLESLLAAVRGGARVTNPPEVDEQRALFRQELVKRLNSAFGQQIPADQAVMEALRQTLQSAPAQGASVGELIAAVLGRLASRS